MEKRWRLGWPVLVVLIAVFLSSPGVARAEACFPPTPPPTGQTANNWYLFVEFTSPAYVLVSFGPFGSSLENLVPIVQAFRDRTQSTQSKVVVRGLSPDQRIPEGNYLPTYSAEQFAQFDGAGGLNLSGMTSDLATVGNGEPPQISSPTEGRVFEVKIGETFKFQVEARDPEGASLYYNLDSNPPDMTISTQGLIVWAPKSESPLGRKRVVLAVSDNPRFTCETKRTFYVDLLAAPTSTTTTTPRPPTEPTSLTQLRTDKTALPIGATTTEDTFLARGQVSDPDGDQVRLEVEVRAVETDFLGTVICKSELVNSGQTAEARCTDLEPGSYHWQARVKDAGELTSPWVSVGRNSENDTDFVVSTPPPPSGVQPPPQPEPAQPPPQPEPTPPPPEPQPPTTTPPEPSEPPPPKPGTVTIPPGFRFTQLLKVGMSGEDVRYLQILLNTDFETQVASSGPGSLGQETIFFSLLTKAAVIRFQEKYAREILKPFGLTMGTGLVGQKTQEMLNRLLTEGDVEPLPWPEFDALSELFTLINSGAQPTDVATALVGLVLARFRLGRLASRVPDKAKLWRFLGGTNPSRDLASNLYKEGIERPAGYAAHHIVAFDARAADAQKLLMRFGIKPNDAANGVFLSSRFHYGLHTKLYYEAVERLLARAKSKEEVIEILKRVGRDLQKDKFPF